MLTIKDILNTTNETQTKIQGCWVPSRPKPCCNLWDRLKDAWEVFRGRADSVIWPDEYEALESYDPIDVETADLSFLKEAGNATFSFCLDMIDDGVDPRTAVIKYSEKPKKGQKLMVQCEVIKDYECNCHVLVRLPDRDCSEKSFHLNMFNPYDLKSYKGWEYVK